MSQIHILDGQKDEILDYITAPNIISDDHKKSLEDTLETYEFITFADKRYSEHLEKRNRIIIPDEDGSLVEFRIFESHKYKDTEGHKAQVFANATYLDLRQANVLFPDNGYTGSASQHAGRALNDTGWRVGIAEGKGTRTLTINNHTNPYEMLKRIAREFELELKFRIEHDGNKVTGRYVDLLERVGQWRGREVEFGKDLDGIRRVEKQDIVTALLGLGPEHEDGTRLEVLVTDEDALRRWGRIDEHGNLKHLIEPYEIQSERSEMTEAEARQYTRTALNKRINTQITYETTIVDLEEVPGMENKKIRFGDTIKIKDTSFNPPLYLEARVFEQNRSIKSKAKKDIKLGDFIEYTEEEVNAIWEQLKKQIQNRVSFYEMAEYTYDKLTIDDKDETVFEDGKTFAEATGIRAEENAKAFAVEEDKKIKLDVEQYADTVAEQKANSALEQAKMYAVAKEVYDIQMQVIADDIADRAPIEYVDGELRHAIDNLEIGGVNIFRPSQMTNLIPSSSGSFTNYSSGQSFHFAVKEGEVYSFSRTDNTNDRFRVVFSGEEPSQGVPFDDIISRDSDLKIEGIKIPQGINYVLLYLKYISGEMPNIQIEKGSKATDYHPSYEDMFSEIEKKADGSTVYTIEQIDNKINNLVSVTQYTTDMDGIVTQLESHGTRIGQNEHAIGLKADASHVDSVENELTRKIGNVEVKADGVITQVSEVRADLDGLEIGGRNLLKGTEDAKRPTGNSNTSSTILTEDGETFVRTTLNTVTGYSYYYVVASHDYNEFSYPQDYVVSATIRAKSSTNFRFGFRTNATEGSNETRYNQYTGTGEWVRLQATLRVTRPFDNILILWGGQSGASVGDTIDIKKVQFEKGNKATDWSPAPEDTDEAINQVSGRVETLDGEITALAGEVSLKASQSVVDSLEGRVSTAEGELRVLPGQINAKVSKDGVIGAINATPEQLLIDFDKVKMTGELEAKHIKSLNGLNVNNQFVVDNAGNVRFSGNLQGASGTFSGEIETGKLKVRAKSIHDFDDFGIELETAQWQADVNNPYKRTGFINFRTDNDALEINRKDINGNFKPLAGFSVEADYSIFTGKMELAPYHTGTYGDVLKLSGGLANHVYMEFYRGSVNRSAYIGIPDSNENRFLINAHGLSGGIYLTGGNVIIRDRLINQATYDTTTGANANVYVATNGYFARSSSAKKYKVDMQPANVDYKKILEIEPYSWFDKGEVERNDGSTNGLRRYYGAIADHFIDVGLPEYGVYHDETGELENFNDRAWILLIPNINDLKDEINYLNMKIQALRSELNARR